MARVRQWYYADNQTQVGPVSEERVEELARAGKIAPDTLVWTPGYAQWVPYREVSPTGLLPAPALCSLCGRPKAPDEVIRILETTVCDECKPNYVQRIREGVLPVTILLYGGFWIRAVAKLVDGLVLFPVYITLFVVAYVLIPLLLVSFSIENPVVFLLVMSAGNLAFTVAYYVVGAAYTTYFLGRFGATPGKMVCRLWVVTPQAKPISYLRAFGRYFAEMLSGLTLGIAYLLAACE